MKVVVIDDDPTGTQSASEVRVLLRWTACEITNALRSDDAVYLQTNSRALNAADARSKVASIRRQIAEVEEILGEPVMSVLRGDSTLRGHVFEESDEFAKGEACPILFVPGFPDAGRITHGGVHYIRCGEETKPVSETEYACDPVFPFRNSNLLDYVRERGHRQARHVPLRILRSTNGDALWEQLLSASPGEVVVPDIDTNDDLDLIATVVKRMWRTGQRVVVRCGAPLAATLAGKRSPIKRRPLVAPSNAPVLVICGSHTDGARAQLNYLQTVEHVATVVVSTEAAVIDPESEGARVGAIAKQHLSQGIVTVLASERVRRSAHRSLENGALVMSALTRAANECKDGITALVTKGGITSAEVVRSGFGTNSAWVRGQVETGVSIWELEHPTVQIVIVPGNMGNRESLANAVRLLRSGSQPVE